MSNREAFEEWYSGTYRETIHILPNGQYASLRQQHSWDAWQARVPEGYVVVPKEPTCEMVSEGFKEMCVVDMRDFSDESAVNIYKAMLEAQEK